MKFSGKTILSLLVLILVVVAYVVSKKSSGGDSLSKEIAGLSASEVVEKFYISVSGNSYDEKSLFNAYFSEPLKRKVVEMKSTAGYNPIICAEDRPAIVRVEMINANETEANYIVTETFSDGGNTKIAVKTKKIADRWFLEDINCFDPKPKI